MKQITFKKAFAIIFICALCASYFLLKEGKQNFSDLTFSNILFNGNNYYLIDFLDSFIESPLLDMVKIRQDTRYRWSTLMYEGEFDETRFHIVADTIDHQLDGAFKQYTWYRTFYHTLQLMNFLRILQYAKEKKIVAYLKKTIQSILNYE